MLFRPIVRKTANPRIIAKPSGMNFHRIVAMEVSGELR